MKILPVSSLLILSFFFSLVGHTQNPTTEYYFKRISIEHGLSQSGVTTMVRDHKGLLWIGTRQGINRVDRNHLKKYMDDYIFQLLEDTQQNLWAITPKGVLRYNPDEDTFLPIINQQLFSICMTKKGVYFGGYAAIYQYDYTSKKIERLRRQMKPTTQNTLNYTTLHEDGLMHIAREKYSRSFKLGDASYSTAQQDEKEGITDTTMDALNLLDEGSNYQLLVINRRVSDNSLQNILFEETNDGYDDYRTYENPYFTDFLFHISLLLGVEGQCVCICYLTCPFS